MGHTSGAKPEIIAKINVVPIIDVSLVLVIILLVTAPIITVSELPVNLPEARSRGAEDERNLSISLGVHGELAVDPEPVDPKDLQRVLQEKLAKPENADILVVVRADAGAPYSLVGEILVQAQAAGASRLAIATKQAVTPAPKYRRVHVTELSQPVDTPVTPAPTEAK